MSDWKQKLRLQEGQSLSFVSSSIKGFMGQTDVSTYEVIGADGQKVGSVTYTDDTAVKGFKRTLTVEQRDLTGEIVVREIWGE